MDLVHKEKSWPKSEHGSASRGTGLKEEVWTTGGYLVDGLGMMCGL